VLPLSACLHLQEVDDLAQVASDVDVLYQTRIQKERFTDMMVGGCLGRRRGDGLEGLVAHYSVDMPSAPVYICVHRGSPTRKRT
jgi:hypothetical protein